MYGSETNAQRVLWRTYLSNPLKYGESTAGGIVKTSILQNTLTAAQEDSPRDTHQLEELFDRLSPDHLGPSKTIAATERGYIGQTLYTNKAKEGDIVCVLVGCSVPMLLRPVKDHHELVGEVYLDGIMYGEAMEALDHGEVQLQEFELH